MSWPILLVMVNEEYADGDWMMERSLVVGLGKTFMPDAEREGVPVVVIAYIIFTPGDTIVSPSTVQINFNL